MLEQNEPEITIACETGWIKLTEKYYSKQEWPEAEVTALLVGDGMSTFCDFFETGFDLRHGMGVMIWSRDTKTYILADTHKRLHLLPFHLTQHLDQGVM